MAFIPTANTAKVVLNGVTGTTPVINTLWFSKDSTFTQADLSDLIDGVHAWWFAELKPIMVDDYTLTSIQAYDMSSETGPTAETTYGETGDQIDNFGSAQDVARVTFYSANRGRGSRGGNDVSPLRDAVLNNQTIDAGFRAALTSTYALLNDYVQQYVVSAAHTVVSHYLNGSPRLAGLVQDVISYAMARSNARTRKSRRSAGS